jgi:hypothetical protein
MRDFLDEIAACYNSGIHAPALLAALSLPEALGAIDTPDEAPDAAYDSWYDRRVGQRHGPAPGHGGALARAIRVAMLHGQSGRFDAFGFETLAFLVPLIEEPPIEGVVMANGRRELRLRLDLFINGILAAAFAHLDELGNAPVVAGLLQPRLLADEVPGGRRVIA